MHHIQRHILKLLIENKEQRYSQLRPKQIEPNQFVYHLKQLMKEDLVIKCNEGYELTSKGRSYADKLDHDLFDVQWDTQPRNVLFLAVHDAARGWLLVRRDKQPTIGKIGFIATDVRLGEPITQTAAVYLEQAYGLVAGFRYICSGCVTLYRGTDLESYVMFQLLYADAPVGDVSDSQAKWHQPAGVQADDVLPSTQPLMQLIEHVPASPKFVELNFVIKPTTA
jgi:hypothetical protein